jgi:PKD repeat protein
MPFSDSYGENWTIGYYKPLNYDSLNSEIILYCHGQGGDENEGYNLLNQISDKRKALIVSPTSNTAPWSIAGLISFGAYEIWLPELFKEIYKHILQRENRNSINVRLIGFSAGGQCVTRYMLIRQGINDSIPIKMAVSINPYFYTFTSDSVNGIHSAYPYGIAQNPYYYMGSSCDEHVKGYYNENYTVMIGTADSVNLNDTWDVLLAQGTTRYERAVNFYNFSQQDAIDRGTSLLWNYAEVPNVGHDGYAMINTKALPTDTVSICEHYLFDMPYHATQKFPPTANFTYSINDTTQCVEFNADCECWWQIEPTTYTWSFSNGHTTTGQNISVALSENSTYNIQLIASNIYDSDTINKTVEINNLPYASFTISDTSLFTPNITATFNFTGLNADSLIWYFGDGTSSNVQNPTHTYQDTGIYIAKLLVYNSMLCVDSLSKKIYVDVLNSVNNLFVNYGITIYYSNNNNMVVINTPELQEKAFFDIYDYSGKLIFTHNLNYLNKGVTNINIQNLAKGAYIGVLRTLKNRNTVKIIK